MNHAIASFPAAAQTTLIVKFPKPAHSKGRGGFKTPPLKREKILHEPKREARLHCWKGSSAVNRGSTGRSCPALTCHPLACLVNTAPLRTSALIPRFGTDVITPNSVTDWRAAEGDGRASNLRASGAESFFIEGGGGRERRWGEGRKGGRCSW